jgi:RHS repeat-associated protein
LKFSSVQSPHAEARDFDQDYRMTGITDTGNSALQNLGYAYYPTNNVQTITDAVNPGNTQNFSYDNLQRLTQAAGGYGSFGFTYDKDGNRLTQTLGGVTTNYGYGTANDLLATLSVGGVQTQAIGYTADGRIASLNPGMQAPGGQYITSLSYNQDARLSAVNASGGALASYTYDAFGQRLFKTISGTNGEIYQYGQDGMLLEETDASGVAQADYIYLNGRPIATLNPSTGALYFLNDDMLGTPQLATDSSQAIAWQASYQPFGTASVSGTITQNLRFPGQYFDVESGWNHNGFRDYLPALGRYVEPDPLAMQGSARYYDPQIGKSVSEDPIRFKGGTDFYTYVGNAPLKYIDPFGLSSLIFNPSTGTITVVNGEGQAVGTFPAGNDAQLGSRGPWQEGTYDYAYHTTHSDDSPDSRFGSNGNFVFKVPGCTGCGVHSGRANSTDRAGRSGVNYATNGCIRTTDEATSLIKLLNANGDPLTSLTVSRTPIPTNIPPISPDLKGGPIVYPPDVR